MCILINIAAHRYRYVAIDAQYIHFEVDIAYRGIYVGVTVVFRLPTNSTDSTAAGLSIVLYAFSLGWQYVVGIGVLFYQTTFCLVPFFLQQLTNYLEWEYLLERQFELLQQDITTI